VRKRAFFKLCALSGSPVLDEFVAASLREPELTVAAARYCAALSLKQHVGALEQIFGGLEHVQAQEVAIALSQMGEVGQLGTFQTLATHKDLLVRQAAVRFLARFPEQSYGFAKNLMRKDDKDSQISAMEILAKIGGGESLALVGSGLNSSMNEVKIKALHLLNGQVPAAYRSRVAELTKDSDPVLAAVARGINLGA
jgi:hypothetical protein